MRITSPAVPAAVAACAAYCEVARDTCPGLRTLEECREFCERNALEIQTDCLDEYTAHYLCIARFEPTCIVGSGAVRANETMCQVELRALKACSNTLCTGSDELGVCPRITCPCPGGPKDTAGFPNDGARPCRCFDATTCVPYCKSFF